MSHNLTNTIIVCCCMLCISCSKLENNNPVFPLPPTVDSSSVGQDSLFGWQAIGHSRGEAIIDIWFTSLSRGFCTCSDGNIYRSNDAGYTWNIIPNSRSFPMQSLFFIDDQYGFAENSNQLEITRDGGKTWAIKPLASRLALNFLFLNASTGYYTDLDSGLYKTVDTGNHWIPVYHPSQDKQGLYAYFLNDANGFVISGEGNCYKTTNGSSTWQEISTGITNSQTDPIFNTLIFQDAFNGFYATKNGLLKTTNGGQTWHIVNPAGGLVNIIQFTDNLSGYYLSDSAIYKTADAGETWTTSCRLSKDTFLGMHFFDQTRGWACTSGGTVYRLAQ